MFFFFIDEKVRNEIERDVNRTKLNGSRMFVEKSKGGGAKRLRRVLYAFGKILFYSFFQ